MLGSGPNRIGQGIEFDYACCHAAFALSDAGYETVMVNCNPETVSTDYDTSDRLYFEPLTVEDVLEIVAAETAAGPLAGVVVQLGGQTPLGLAAALERAGVPIVGTTPAAIHLAEDRREFGKVLEAAGLLAPRFGTAFSYEEAREVAAEIGYPVLVRPSYVLGGRGMEIVYDETSLESYVSRATSASPEHPVLVDRFLDDAVEVDVDAIFDGTELYLAGVMEHIEEAGIHSGDSACALPPITLGKADLIRIRQATEAIARGVGVRGLVNVQYAAAGRRAVCAGGQPAGLAHRARSSPRRPASRWPRPRRGSCSARPSPQLRTEGLLPASGDGADMPFDSHIAVKEAVLPFNRFTGVDTVLGPEMKSTGEVMGIDAGFGVAYAKSQSAAYGQLPTKGRVFVSLANRDKRAMIFPVKRLVDLGFEVIATEGTAQVLRRNGVARHGRPQALGGAARRCGRTHPRRRGRPGDQHARSATGPGSTVTRSAAPASPATPLASQRCPAQRPPCRASRRCCAATSERPPPAGMACRACRPARERRARQPWRLNPQTAQTRRPTGAARPGAAAAGPGASGRARRRLHPDRGARPADRGHRPARPVRRIRGGRSRLRTPVATVVLDRARRPGRRPSRWSSRRWVRAPVG